MWIQQKELMQGLITTASNKFVARLMNNEHIYYLGPYDDKGSAQEAFDLKLKELKVQGGGTGSHKKKRAVQFPKSAYAYYSASNWAAVKAALPHGSVFTDIGRVITQNWHKLSVEDRRPFDKLALADKERCRGKQSAYDGQSMRVQTHKIKRKAEVVPQEPRRDAFSFYD